MSLLIAPIEALTDARLKDTERRVLLALYSFRNKNADTVWPSLQALAERALINDHTRISKITKSLAEKGWLTKKKKGFTGCNEYRLSVPAGVPVIDDQDTNLDDSAKLEECTKSNLANYTKSNLDDSAKYKEHQSEHQIEQPKDIVGKPDYLAICKRVIEYLNAKTGKKFKNVKAHHEFITGRLREGFTETDLITVIDRKTADWLHDPYWNKFLQPSTLFRPRNFDGYLNATPVAGGQRHEIRQPTGQPLSAVDRVRLERERRFGTEPHAEGEIIDVN